MCDIGVGKLVDLPKQLFPNGDVASLVQKLNALLNDKMYRTTLGKRAREAIFSLVLIRFKLAIG